MERTVFGMKVDENLYKKYNFDEKTGLRKLYMINGREMSLFAVEFCAVSKTYEEESPETVAAARRIMEEVQREIVDYYAAKEGREEHTAMKHDTFDGYLKDLQEIHTKVAPERIQLREKMDQAQKRWEENQREFKGDEHFLAREKLRFLDAQEEYKNSIQALQQRTQEEIRAVQDEYERHVTDFYAANGNRLDDAAVQLLNSGIRLTDAEIDSMVEQNRSNPTMLRLISDHCKKQGIENRSARIYGSLAMKSGKDEIEAFEAVADMLRKAVSENDVTSGIWAKADSHFERLSNQAIQGMNQLYIRPEMHGTAEQAVSL